MKMSLLHLLVCCATLANLAGTESNLSKQSIHSRALAGSVPYQVSIRVVENDQHICSGSIINARWILTAAQCFDGILPDANYIKVGSNLLSEGGTSYDILDALVHPNYEFANSDFDYALVQTVDPIAFDSAVQPVALDTTQDSPSGGSIGTYTGWRVTNDAPDENQLQSIELEVLSTGDCINRLPQFGANQLCTLNTEAGTCAGDTGGPLLVNGKQVGVSSKKLPCEADVPNVFADTTLVYLWIQANTGAGQ